jgi:NTP pyrophosphatase (non-canonical NTP hydrolase)
MNINELVERAYENAVNKGWHENERPVPEVLCLLHAEISEALEEYRDHRPLNEIRIEDGKPEGFVVEVADLLIRCFDLCGEFNLDIENALKVKMDYNETRPYRHGGKAA